MDKNKTMSGSTLLRTPWETMSILTKSCPTQATSCNGVLYILCRTLYPVQIAWLIWSSERADGQQSTVTKSNYASCPFRPTGQEKRVRRTSHPHLKTTNWALADSWLRRIKGGQSVWSGCYFALLHSIKRSAIFGLTHYLDCWTSPRVHNSSHAKRAVGRRMLLCVHLLTQLPG